MLNTHKAKQPAHSVASGIARFVEVANELLPNKRYHTAIRSDHPVVFLLGKPTDIIVMFHSWGLTATNGTETVTSANYAKRAIGATIRRIIRAL